LFGVGCGGWEQTGWASQTITEDELTPSEFKKRKKVLESSQALFGQMNQNQSEFERTMRDRTHEFLNIPRDRSLDEHLSILSMKYPLSGLTSGMRTFFSDCKELLGLPELAKYQHRNTNLIFKDSQTLSTLSFSRWMGLLDPDECMLTAPPVATSRLTSRYVATRTWEL